MRNPTLTHSLQQHVRLMPPAPRAWRPRHVRPSPARPWPWLPLLGALVCLLLAAGTSQAPQPTERTTRPPDGQPTGFPFTFALQLGGSSGLIALDLTAQLAGQPVLHGQATTTLDPEQHDTLEVHLDPLGPGSTEMAPAADMTSEAQPDA